MTRACWPYMVGQCPWCMYFRDATPVVDDAGHEIVGFCRNPRIRTELSRPQVNGSEPDRCPGYIRSTTSSGERAGRSEYDPLH